MGAKISVFPMYSKYNTYNIDYELGEYQFYYHDSRNSEHSLCTQDSGDYESLHHITDEDGIWSPDTCDLSIKNYFHIRNCHHLFGSNGIASKDSTIGFALMWKSSDSRQRGVIPVADFKYEKKEVYIELDHSFMIGKFRGVVTFIPVLYLKNGGRIFPEEQHLANETGTIIGYFDEYSICLDGNGSVFPIYGYSDPNGPLWELKCDWENPSQDSFNEYVQILLNTAHVNYKFIDRKNKSFNMALLKEIISSALTILILKLKMEDFSYWSDIELGNDLKHGSVSEAVNYFITALEWDASTPENLSMSIRNYLDQRM